MELKGRFTGVTRDISSNDLIVSFKVKPFTVAQLDSITEKDLDLIIKQHKKKRSLSANAYAWVLMDKIARILKTSKEEVYEEMLQSYGVVDENMIQIAVRPDVDMNRVEGHWLKVGSDDEYNFYMMLRGSSEYNTKEMADFIDGIVFEAKELGIETLTPDEIERMKQEWKA